MTALDLNAKLGNQNERNLPIHQMIGTFTEHISIIICPKALEARKMVPHSKTEEGFWVFGK